MEIPGHALTRNSRIFHSKLLSNSQYEYQANKNLAFKWFHSWKTFQNIIPGKTYAQALVLGTKGTQVAQQLGSNIVKKSKVVDQAPACLGNKNVVKNSARETNDDIQKQQLTFPKLHGSVAGGKHTPVPEKVQISLQNRFLPLQDIQNDCSCTQEPTHSVPTVEISHNMVSQSKNLNSYGQRVTNGDKGESCKIQPNSDTYMEQTSMEVNQTNPKIHTQGCSEWQGQDQKNVYNHVTDLNMNLNGNCSLNSIHEINCKPIHVFDINWGCKTNGMCVEKQRCIAQTGGYFGFVPQTSLKLYQGPSIKWEHIPDILQAHVIIKNSGTHNYLKCRIPVNSHLNIDRWQYHLKDYWDQQLVDFF